MFTIDSVFSQVLFYSVEFPDRYYLEKSKDFIKIDIILNYIFPVLEFLFSGDLSVKFLTSAFLHKKYVFCLKEVNICLIDFRFS